MMYSIFYNAYQRHNEMYPRIMIQETLHYIIRSCKVKPELNSKHYRTHSYCRTHALKKRIEKIVLISVFLNIFYIFSKTGSSYDELSYFISNWYVIFILFDRYLLTNSNSLMISKLCGMRSGEK